MRKILSVLALALSSTIASADFTGKDAGGSTVTFSNPNTCTSVVCVPVAQLVNASGTTLLGTAGTANAGVLTVQGIASMTPLSVSGTFWQATQPISGTVTANLGTIAGAATSALQTTGNSSLSSIDGKVPALGQALAAASVPVILPAATITTLTPPTTVTANLGTLNGAATAANQILTQGPIAPNTATATKSDVIGLQYNSTQATFTNGQQGSVQGTSRGALYVATGADAFAVNATLGAETTKVIGTTRNLGNSGAVIDFAGQNASSPANSWLIGGQFNTTPTTITSGNSSPLQLDNAGNLLVNIKAGASSGAVAQGSTTSGQTGGLMQAAVTTSAPTYTTAQTNPLSMDTSGNLRVSVSSAVGLAQGSTTSGQTGSMIMGAVTTSAPTYTTAQTSPISLDTAGNVRVNPGTVTVTATNLSVNNAQINGVTPLMGNGATGTGSQRVTIASDSSARAVGGEGATGSAAPSGAVQMGMRSGANLVAGTQASASAAISGNTATTTQLVALSASNVIHVTSFDFMAAGTANVTLVYGTGTNCGTGTTALTGAYPLTAQAGISKGSGQGPVLVVPAGNALCWTNSAAVQVSGSVSYTQFVP